MSDAAVLSGFHYGQDDQMIPLRVQRNEGFMPRLCLPAWANRFGEHAQIALAETVLNEDADASGWRHVRVEDKQGAAWSDGCERIISGG